LSGKGVKLDCCACALHVPAARALTTTSFLYRVIELIFYW
jgi:hypothetical protein